MGGDRCHNVVLAVSVHVVNAHFGSAGAKVCGMEFPETLAGPSGGLLPPSAVVDDIHATVTIDVAYTHAMRRREAGLRNRMHLPCGSGVCGIGLRIGHSAAGPDKQNLGTTVAIDVAEHLDFRYGVG